ncbi:MAG: DMT family transporter [Acidobacteria bacterium]|nr:MAG: DMT family transporter [Acidobacteriota bacterium]
MSHRAHRWVDAILVVMVLIWGVNYSVIKRAFAEIHPQPYNAIRMVIATAVFLAAMRWAARAAKSGRKVSRIFYTDARPTASDKWRLVGLGLVGQFLYQICFVGGVNGTSVSNSALIIGATPVVVAIASAALGHERITKLHWLGAATSAFGIYLVVGHGANFGGAHLRGDLLVMASVGCWAVYSMGAATLITRHSPLYVTGMTFAIGTVPYFLFALPALAAIDWRSLSAYVYISVVLSALMALCLAYLIWYTAIQAIGVARTSLYSNLVPVAAMAVAAVWLGEPITPIKVAGTAAVLTGLWLTRLGRRTPVAAAVVGIEE